LTAKLLQIVQTTSLDRQEIAARTARIHATVLARSSHIDAGNFGSLHPDDLRLLVAEYDAAFFGGKIRESLGRSPLDLGLSTRMTSAGGKTTRYTDRRNGGRRYSIGVSTTILFGCFQADDHRPITASGTVCRDRLEALQRVIEHELVHLVELILWDKSSCSQGRFRSVARRFFGHTDSRHQLITPRERAIVKFGIQPGMMVRFRFDGTEYTGMVNRINRRATVLVEDNRGPRYTNGKHYAKFYVPVQDLKAVE